MSLSRILVLALSLTAGGAAAMLMTTREPEVKQLTVTESVPEERVEILMANTDLEQRDRLAPDDLVWRSWPKDSLLDGYITREANPEADSEFIGNLVRVAILEGEPVRAEKISASGHGYLSTMLSSGKRAVSVRVTPESTAGGFILPEDRVDVLHTVVESGASGVSRTIVTNVRILAIDQQLVVPEANSVPSAKTATLELSSKQAEIVSAAQSKGVLSLSLRSSEDNSDSQVIAKDSNSTVLIFGGGRSRSASNN